jgi:hypothetical protein
MSKVIGGPFDGGDWPEEGDEKIIWTRLDNGVVRLVTYRWNEDCWRYLASTNASSETRDGYRS